MVQKRPYEVYSVFLSSANGSDNDAREYRLAAKKLIREEFPKKWHVIDMDDFDPADSPPIDVCRDRVLECHVYIGILGFFYGSISEEDLSYTEYEFNVARDGGLETAIFMLPYGPPNSVDERVWSQQGELLPRQQAFRQRVQSPDMRLTVKHVQDLEQFKLALRHYLQELDPSGLKGTKAPVTSNEGLADYSHLAFDRRPWMTCRVSDLDQSLLNEFLNQKGARDVLASKGMLRAVMPEQLELFGLMYQGWPTIGAVLCFAPVRLLVNDFPACCLHMVIYNETSSTSSRPTILTERDNLLNLFERGMVFLRTGAGLKRVGEIGSRERDVLEVPDVALREAFANALVHRDYETPDMRNQPTRIEVYPNRVEITSFGSLVGGLPIESLNRDIEPRVTLRRNGVVAETFLIMTHTELNGTGVNRARSAMREAGLPAPDVSYGDDRPSIRVMFQRPDLSDEALARRMAELELMRARQVVDEFVTVVDPTQDLHYKNLRTVEIATFLTSLSEAPRSRATLVCVGQDGTLINVVDLVLADYFGSANAFIGQQSPLNDYRGRLYKVDIAALAGRIGRSDSAKAAAVLRAAKERLMAMEDPAILLLDHLEALQRAPKGKDLDDLRFEIGGHGRLLVFGIFHAPENTSDFMMEARMGRDNIRLLTFNAYDAVQTKALIDTFYMPIWRKQGRGYIFSKDAFDLAIALEPGAWHDQRHKVLPGLVIDLTGDAMETALGGETAIRETARGALQALEGLRRDELPRAKARDQFEPVLKRAEEEIKRLIEPARGGFLGIGSGSAPMKQDPRKPIEITGAHIVAELLCHNRSEFHFPGFAPIAVRV